MYLLTVWVTSGIMLIGSFWYCRKVWRREFSPPPASFIILSLTFPLAFWMYAQGPEWGFAANIGLTTAIASVWLICLFLIVRLWIDRRLRIEITPFQWITIVVSVAILAFWLIADDPFVAYVLLQISALIGYVPIYQKLWRAERNPDSIIFWISILLAACVASYAAYEKNDIQSWIYIARAIPSTGAVVVLMARIELKKKALP